MTEDGSLYYNYTNKGSVYQFDLSKLTPEERQKFSRLNDRQKLRFITLKDMEEPGKMKNEIAIRPDFNDDKSNERNNELRALTAKLEYINRIIKNDQINKDIKNLSNQHLKDVNVKNTLINESEGLISPSDIDYVLSVSDSATVPILKKYYTALLTNLKTEGEQSKIQKQLFSNGFSKNFDRATWDQKHTFISDVIKALKDDEGYFALADKLKKAYGYDISTVDLVKLKNVIPDSFLQEIKDAKNQQENIIQSIQFITGESADYIKDLIKDKKTHDDTIKRLEELNNSLSEGYTDSKSSNSNISNLILTDDDTLNIGKLKQSEYDDIQEILNEINQLPKLEQKSQKKILAHSLLKNFGIPQLIDEYSKIDPKTYNKNNVYTEINNILNNAQSGPGTFDTIISWFQNDVDKQRKEKLINTIKNYVDTVKKIDNDGDIIKPTQKYIDKKISNKSGSIKDRLRRIFRGNTEEDIKKISDNQVKQYSQTQGDLQSLKDRVNVLEQEVKNLQTNQFQQPQSQPQQQAKPSFLNDIRNPVKPLKPTEPSPKSPNPPDDSLTSQFKKIMEERRKDIEPDEVEESDDEEWLASGVTKMSLADFLMNL